MVPITIAWEPRAGDTEQCQDLFVHHQHPLAWPVLLLRCSSGRDEAGSDTISPKGWQSPSAGSQMCIYFTSLCAAGTAKNFSACLRNKSGTTKEFANGSKKVFGKTRWRRLWMKLGTQSRASVSFLSLIPQRLLWDFHCIQIESMPLSVNVHAVTGWDFKHAGTVLKHWFGGWEETGAGLPLLLSAWDHNECQHK